MQVYSVVTNLHSISEFIEGGSIESDLASLELESALEAFSKARDATDFRSQLWSVVNHLETAEAALARSVSKRGFITEITRSMSRFADEVDLLKVCLLMIACYIYLGEPKLAKIMVSRARSHLKRRSDSSVSESAGQIAAVMTGSVIVQAFKQQREIEDDKEVVERSLARAEKVISDAEATRGDLLS